MRFHLESYSNNEAVALIITKTDTDETVFSLISVTIIGYFKLHKKATLQSDGHS